MTTTTIPTATTDPKAALRRAFAERLIRPVYEVEVNLERAKVQRQRAAHWAAQGEFHWAASDRRSARYWDGVVAFEKSWAESGVRYHQLLARL